ncbi:hypothetical protein Q5P01_007016 [Channa striata]|uniref:Pleckstrin homology domain-containing family G member 4B n=1 Tax=Channa striata TaxID=64152 RepID=A0AA88NCE2_CHASR|nr:hypothetical protein Q5P01_007016 [Channa striata]
MQRCGAFSNSSWIPCKHKHSPMFLLDSESLDRCIQNTLSALYPPFQATSSTVLCQVLNVVESCYRGDRLRYLLHFLLPAKHFLQNLQQDTCVHEGWPLCLHEKVVVQLCPLDQRLLRPGDFYLLVFPATPPPSQAHSAFCSDSVTSSPRLHLCSLSASGHHVEQQEVSKIALRSLFTMAWLDSVNKEREKGGASRLDHCLLSASGDVFRVPWEDLVYPQFISCPLNSDVVNASHNLCNKTDASRQDAKHLHMKTDQSPAISDGDESEGEYVELTELPLPCFSPQKGSLTQSISQQHRARTSTTTHTPPDTNPNSASTNTSQPINTHSAAGPFVEVSSHTRLCSTLIEENLSTDSCGSVVLTPISPISSSTLLEALGAPSTYVEQQVLQKQIGGTNSSGSLHTEYQNCKELILVEDEKCKEKLKQGETEKERVEAALSRSPKKMLNIAGSTDEGAENEKGDVQQQEVEQLEETECRSDLLQHTQNDEELEDESKESGKDGEEEFEEVEVEVEEEVQLIIMRQSQERREEVEVMKDKTGKEEEKARRGEEIHVCRDESYSESNTQHKHLECSYSEHTVLQTHSEDFRSEKNMLETPPVCSNSKDGQQCDSRDSLNKLTPSEDPCSEIGRLQVPSKESYPEHTGKLPESEESNKPRTYSENIYSDNYRLEPLSDDSTCENNRLQIYSDDSYSENNTLERHFVEENRQKTESEHANKLQTQFGKCGCEYNTLERHPEGCCSDKKRRNKDPCYSYFETKPNYYFEDSYSENNGRGSSGLQTSSEDSYFENRAQQAESRGSIKLQPDSYSENNKLERLSDCASSEESRQQPKSEQSNKLQTPFDESYCEYNSLETHFEGSCSKINTLNKRPDESYCESIQNTHFEDFCPENCVTQSESGESSNVQTHSVNSNSENNMLERHSGDSYSEKPQTIHPENSYCENGTVQTHSEKSESSTLSVFCPDVDTDSVSAELGESESGQKNQEENKEEEDQEEEEEEVGAGRTEKLQTKGLSPKLYTGPTEPVPEPPAAAPVAARLSQSSFFRVLLSSGAVCLPGTRDRSGRALLTVCTSSSVWFEPACDSAELFGLLLYYMSTLRDEVRTLGLTVLVDARRAAPAPSLFSALRSLQKDTPGSIHTVLLLVNNKDTSLHLDKPAQVETLSSLKSVQKHVELHQLPTELGGSFSFSHNSWLCFRSRIEQLKSQCEDVIKLLQKSINILQSTPLPAASKDAEQCLSKYKAVMRSILEDAQLVQLQKEGGASLSRLRREESSISLTEDYQAEMESVSLLYDQVDELLHRLVTLSNSRTQELNFIVDFGMLEQDFNEVRSWLDEVGEVCLKSLEEPADSLELVMKKQQEFSEFYRAAYDQCTRGEALLARLDQWDDLSSTDLQVYELKVQSFWARLQDFSQRMKSTWQNVDQGVQLYRFLDQAYGWALEGMHQLAAISMEDCTVPDKCQAAISCLKNYQQQHPPIPDTRFQEMKVVAGELRGEHGLRQWSFAWSKCQETKKMLQRKMEAALRTRDSAHRCRSDSSVSRSSVSSRKSFSRPWGNHDSPSSCPPEEDATTSLPPHNTSSLVPSTSSPLTPQQTPLLHRLFRSFSTDDHSDHADVSPSSPGLHRFGSSVSTNLSSACSTSRRRQQLRKTQSFDCPPTPEVLRYGPCPRAFSEPARRGNTGVFIRGLEVSSTEVADRTLCPRSGAHGWAGHGPRSPRTPGTPRSTGGTAADLRPRGSKLRHIVEEMVTTEREYVRSLRYIIHHYFPEMDRMDLPQDLRGKRTVVFGNLEKLLDFHSQFFLRELEACWKHPLRVPHCFLRHCEQFGLYALYSKNKPKSDALLASHGNSFFRRKQAELGDKMDLSSYLLKPIQRMSKYALLLTDLMKEVGEAQEAEFTALQAATSMVKFQLRHGNDLLAMDAIQDCDVNLKEQGQLIRQDEFTVLTGRRKCQRHIFLFEELILFSKPKRIEGGLDVFTYKHSFKTADVGLTESTGDSGLRFEIWFRRRTTKNQTFTLQATTADVKSAWTSDIARILWNQATRNKEMRLKEMVSMGVGNKPFLDIQPSDAAISDRAVHYIMKSRGPRTRASIAVSVFDHSTPFKRGAVTSDPAPSGPSSSTLLGPLNLHVYSQTLSSLPPAENSFIASCIEEDEQEHETGSQPSMTTESSGSSSRCLSGSTGSDSGCVSAHLQEALPEEPSAPSQPPSSRKQHLSSRYISAKSPAVVSPASIV